MRCSLPILLLCLCLSAGAVAQTGKLVLPSKIEAGTAFSVGTNGSGKGTLYIVGPSQVFKQDLQLGEKTSIAAGSLYSAGHYIAVLTSTSETASQSFDVMPASTPVNLSFLAKPSRLPVGHQGGIMGTVYAFDSYQNLVVAPSQVTFELSNPSGATTSHTIQSHNGAASIQMDSTPREGNDTFVARIGNVSTTRVIRQVAGDPCGLKVRAHSAGEKIAVETDPVRDCSGNAVPDGTIVTFTEAYEGTQSTVDVPLKRGVAKVELPAHRGATISVASGVVLGNQIRWEQ
jgi:hypothetical protein